MPTPAQLRVISVALWICVAAAPGLAREPGLPAGEDFGAGLTLDSSLALSQVAAQPNRYADQLMLMHGTVSAVCQKKGCWTVLRDGAAHVRVRFKDYGFFLPPDSSGKRAFVEGVLTLKTLSEKEARHYESEAPGGDPARIRGPQVELSFMASGVRLVVAE